MTDNYPAENMFGKMRGRYDEVMAARDVKDLRQQALDNLWALSMADVAWVVGAHANRNKTGSHPLRMTMAEAK